VTEELATRFDPTSFEARWYAAWEASGAFTPDPTSEKQPFVILIPPPNVTGKLHIGHALQFTLQDLVVRWRRMQGRNALWLPGTDHAGIATQVMVERELAKEGTSRFELGRERFLERMWAWKAQYKDNISRQAKALGASCDWSRERFTLDDMLSKAVRRAFVQLYNEGLIYRADRLINWCPRCHTALSDLEVVHKDIDGGMWDFAYPVEGGGEMIREVYLDRATWNDVPQRFEAGTPNIADAAAFPAALDMLEEIGMAAVRAHEEDLTAYALDRLASLGWIQAHGPRDAALRGGLVSFVDPDIHPHDLATVLDTLGIAVRAGHHCAQPLMRRLGVVATVRASFAIHCDRDDVDALVDGLVAARRYFGLA